MGSCCRKGGADGVKVHAIKDYYEEKRGNPAVNQPKLCWIQDENKEMPSNQAGFEDNNFLMLIRSDRFLHENFRESILQEPTDSSCMLQDLNRRADLQRVLRDEVHSRLERNPELSPVLADFQGILGRPETHAEYLAGNEEAPTHLLRIFYLVCLYEKGNSFEGFPSWWDRSRLSTHLRQLKKRISFQSKGEREEIITFNIGMSKGPESVFEGEGGRLKRKSDSGLCAGNCDCKIRNFSKVKSEKQILTNVLNESGLLKKHQSTKVFGKENELMFSSPVASSRKNFFLELIKTQSLGSSFAFRQEFVQDYLRNIYEKLHPSPTAGSLSKSSLNSSFGSQRQEILVQDYLDSLFQNFLGRGWNKADCHRSDSSSRNREEFTQEYLNDIYERSLNNQFEIQEAEMVEAHCCLAKSTSDDSLVLKLAASEYLKEIYDCWSQKVSQEEAAQGEHAESPASKAQGGKRFSKEKSTELLKIATDYLQTAYERTNEQLIFIDKVLDFKIQTPPDEANELKNIRESLEDLKVCQDYLLAKFEQALRSV